MTPESTPDRRAAGLSRTRRRRDVPPPGPEGVGAAMHLGEYDEVMRALLEFGLTGYQGRTLIALMLFGAAAPAQLALFAEIPRTAIYPVLNSLRALGLAEPEGGASRFWSGRTRSELVELLRAAGDRELREMAARKEAARLSIGSLMPERDRLEAPGPVWVQRDLPAVQGAWARCLARATWELLVINRAPYEGDGNPNPAALELLARGVDTRALYQAGDLVDSVGLRTEATVFARAGARLRVVDSVPLRLAIFDRRTVLVFLEEGAEAMPDGEVQVHVEHRDYAAFACDLFERLWAEGRPYEDRS